MTVAYDYDNYVSLTWYDNRDGTSTDGGVPTYGEVPGTSGASEYASNMTAYSTGIAPYSSEGSTVAPTNLCIGFAQESFYSSSPTATKWYVASNGASTIFNWEYGN